MCNFDPKVNFLYVFGDGVKLLVSSYQETNETPFRVENIDRYGSNWPKNLDIRGQKSILCIVIAIFVSGAYNHYTWGYNFPIGTTPKKFPFPS